MTITRTHEENISFDGIKFGVPRDIGEIFDFPRQSRSTADFWKIPKY